MKVKYKVLRNEYSKCNGKNIIVEILRLFGIILPEEADISNLYIDFHEQIITVTDYNTLAKYYIYLEEDTYTTIKDLGNYTIEKKYYYDEENAISKCISVTHGQDKYHYTEHTNEINRIRSIKKTTLYNGTNVPVFNKDVISPIDHPQSTLVNTITYDFLNTRNITKTDNTEVFYYFDHKENSENEYEEIVETVFIEKPSKLAPKSNKSFIKRNLFSTNTKDINSAILAVRVINNDHTSTKVITIKDCNEIEVKIISLIDDIEVNVYNSILKSSTNNSFTTDDLFNIIDFLKMKKKVSETIIKEINAVRNAFVKNKIYKQCNIDDIDCFLSQYSYEPFEKISFEILLSIDYLAKSIDKVIYDNTTKSTILELKN